jgi:hypothetical protein
VADGWCWFVLREKYCWLIAGGWFVLREKYCWLVADTPSEQGASLSRTPRGTSKKDSINIDKLLKTKLIRTNQPPTESTFPFHPLNLF